VKAVPGLTVVAPLRLTVPVPVAKALPPEIVVSPLRVTLPAPVWKVPAPVATMCRFLALATVVWPLR